MAGRKYTEANGHRWIWGSWHCYTHNRRCDPWAPVTAADLVAMAAKDGALDDDAFVALSRALRGDDPVDDGGDL